MEKSDKDAEVQRLGSKLGELQQEVLDMKYMYDEYAADPNSAQSAYRLVVFGENLALLQEDIEKDE